MTNYPWVVRERCQFYALMGTPDDFNHGVAGAISGTFNRICKVGIPDDRVLQLTAELRHLMWGWIFTENDHSLGLISSKQMTPQRWNALYRWMGGDWHKVNMRPQFEAEARWLLNCAISNYQSAVTSKNYGVIEPMSAYILRWITLQEIGGDLAVAMPHEDISIYEKILEGSLNG
jgi:hypothetical protein